MSLGVKHGQPIPPQGLQSPLLWQQGTTILPVHPREGTGRNIIMNGRNAPVTMKWPGEAPGMGHDSRTVPIDAPTTTDQRSMTHRDKTRCLPHDTGLGRWSPEDSD
jgi:hypothetical protein